MTFVMCLKTKLKMAYILPMLAIAFASLALPSPVRADQPGAVTVQLTYRNGVTTPGFVTIEYGCVNPSMSGIVSIHTQEGWVSSDGGAFTPTCGSTATAFATWLHIYGQAQTNYGAIYYTGVPSDGSFNLTFVVPLTTSLGSRVHN